ncbi:SDR family NAD(P)-dependent oxidoreductase [Roseicyclus sp.]|uniref:SDR family NAD(P)-dependent oxidoreductase n=1 Tax=Roseicyclus sp. TaxID=1914329 RepID=UPI003F6CF01A
MMTFEGQVAVVTGGAQGIGQAVAKRIAAAGGRIVLWDIDLPLASIAAADLGIGGLAYGVDVKSWESVSAACAQTLSACGRIDVLVHAAGIAGPNAPLAEYDVAAFAEIQAVNLLGTFHVNRAVVPGMQAQNYGRIVNIASVAGKDGNPNASAYSASKAAVIGLTKSLGKELANHDIAVNCVTPAAARTRIFDQMSEEHISYMLSKIPRGRFLELDEAAAMISWIASRENSFTTGSVFDLSGGRATY